MSGVEAVVVTWLVRYGHVLAGACWAGGYVLLALVVVPTMRRQPIQSLVGAVIGLVSVSTYLGVATIVFGLALVTRTRGFGSLLHGEWGAIVLLGCLKFAGGCFKATKGSVPRNSPWKSGEGRMGSPAKQGPRSD